MDKPKVIIALIFLAFVASFFIAKYWDKIFPSKTAIPADGTPCTIPASGNTPAQSGIIKSGVCTTSGGVNPNGNPTSRETLDNISNGVNPVAERTINPPITQAEMQQRISKLKSTLRTNILPVTLPPSCVAWIYAPANNPNNAQLFSACIAEMQRQ